MSDEQQKARPVENPLYYDDLAAPFERTHFRDGGGGVKLEYIDGEQCASRLNETLGFLGWSFVIVEHGIHAEADECWVLGELTVSIGDRVVKRQQFGSNKIKRSRSSGAPLDIGFDLKAAGTDALKKCAQVLGVALYLTDPEERAEVKAAQQAQWRGAAKPTNEVAAAAQLTGAPPQRQACDQAFYTRKWHASVKGTRFEQDDVRAKFLAWYSSGRFDSLAKWLEDATGDEAETLIATVKEHIAREAQKASA